MPTVTCRRYYTLIEGIYRCFKLEVLHEIRKSLLDHDELSVLAGPPKPTLRVIDHFRRGE
jgi:hypothetical protein